MGVLLSPAVFLPTPLNPRATLKVLITLPFLQIFKIRFVVCTLIPFNKGQLAGLANKTTGKKIEIVKELTLIFMKINKY